MMACIMESAAVAVYVSIAAVVVTLLVRRLATCVYHDICLKAPLIPATFGRCTSVLLALCGIANLSAQGVAVALGSVSDIAEALLAVYNLFSVLWILAPDRDAAAVVVGVGALFPVSALVVQFIYQPLGLGAYLLIAVAVFAVIDVAIYVVFVPCFESDRQNRTTELDENMNQVDQLRGQLLELQVKIRDIEERESAS